jgi:hypothetical protein
MKRWGVLVAMITGCSTTPDTCGGGDFGNLASPHVIGDLQPTDSPVLAIGWTRDDKLPDSYFSGVVVASQTPVEIAPYIVGVSFTSPDQLVVRFGDLTAYLSNHTTVELTIELPDPRAENVCTHPGEPDRYFVDVKLGVDPAGHVSSSTFDQTVELGAI